MSATHEEPQNLITARRYLAAIENREDLAVFTELLHPDIVQVELPNRLNPNGRRGNQKKLLEGLPVGRQLMSAERCEIVNAVAAGDRVALEVRWSGTLAVSFGEQLPDGATMRAFFGLFPDFKDRLIIGQRNYDRFEPWCGLLICGHNPVCGGSSTSFMFLTVQ